MSSTLLVRLEAVTGTFRAGLLRAEADVKRFGKGVETSLLTTDKSFRQFQRTVGLGLAATGAIVEAALFSAAKGAIGFEQSMRNANTIMRDSNTGAQLSAKAFDMVSESVRDLSRTVPQSAKTLADGLYQIASSGFQGAEGMAVLRASATAASAGLTDTATAANAITAVLNAYGKTGFEAAHVSDVLFQTVNVGVITFEQLAHEMGDFVGLTAQAGVSIDQASSALATMTLSGINAAEAGTSLNRLMQALIQPTDELAQVMAKLGLNVESLSSQVVDPQTGLSGLANVMEKLRVESGGNVEVLLRWFSEIRAARGALALMANEGENYRKSIAAISDPVESAQAAQRAFNEQSKSTAFQLQVARNQISASGQELTQNFLPVIAKATGFVGNLANGFGALSGATKTTAGLFIAIGGGVTVLAGAALLAVPAIAAFKTGLIELGVSAATTSALMQAAIPVVGLLFAALTIGAVVLSNHGRATQEAKMRTDAFVQALQAEKEGVDGATDAEIRNQIIKADLVTLTTRTEDLIDAIEHALGPLRRLGVNPSRIALMLSMTIATVPVIAGFAVQVREAQRARGVPVRPLTFVVPLLVMALKHSDELADALTARGID